MYNNKCKQIQCSWYWKQEHYNSRCYYALLSHLNHVLTVTTEYLNVNEIDCASVMIYVSCTEREKSPTTMIRITMKLLSNCGTSNYFKRLLSLSFPEL